MPMRFTPMRPLPPISPIKVFLLVLVVVFAVEAAIMMVLPEATASSPDGILLALVDALLLVGVLCPVLWMLVVRPLRTLLAERGALLERTLHIQEEERARLARDLHDELGQMQTAILLGLRTVTDAHELSQAHLRAEGVRQMAVQAVDATRRMARGLSPTVLKDLGLGVAVGRMCEDFGSATGIQIPCDIRIGDARFDPKVEINAYRVVQEAVTNAAKHGGATMIQVAIRLDAGHLDLRVTDNGRGLPEPGAGRGAGHGLGLTGIRERIVLLDGALELTSGQPAGTTLHARIPAQAATP